MRATILGSGTLVPSGARNSAGYFLELPDARIMADCGAGTLHALARYGLPWEQMTHLYVSHFHVDHIGELPALFFAFIHGMRTMRKEALTVIGPKGLDRVMDGLQMAFGPNLLEPAFPINVRIISPGERVELGSESTLSVAKTPHTPESLAVRIESDGRALCYTGDTGSSEDLALFFGRADLLISECSFREPRESVPHLSVREAARMAAQAGAARLILTHFYFDVDEAELKEEIGHVYSGEVMFGRDGLTVEV